MPELPSISKTLELSAASMANDSEPTESPSSGARFRLSPISKEASEAASRLKSDDEPTSNSLEESPETENTPSLLPLLGSLVGAGVSSCRRNDGSSGASSKGESEESALAALAGVSISVVAPTGSSVLILMLSQSLSSIRANDPPSASVCDKVFSGGANSKFIGSSSMRLSPASGAFASRYASTSSDLNIILPPSESERIIFFRARSFRTSVESPREAAASSSERKAMERSP